MSDVFISYSRNDRPIAERLAGALEARGVSYWMDSHLTGGTSFTKVTEDELNKAGKVIVLWSKTSVESGWVCDEAQAGREQGKLIPLTIDGSQPPMGFRQIQTIDMADWTRHGHADLPKALLDALTLGSEAGEATSNSMFVSRRKVILAAAIALIFTAIAGIMLLSGSLIGGRAAEARIVVMPLTADGNDPDEGPLAAGITSELIIRLRRVPELQVATGRADEPPGDNALYGSVRKDGEQLRVAVRLEDKAGNVVWSDNFDRTLNDLLYVQEDIAKAVADTLSVSLDVGINSRAYGGTDNPEAFANYVQGRSYRYIPDRSRPTAYLERAVALDPDFAKGWEELSYIYGVSIYSAGTEERLADLMAKLDYASAKALELSPDLWNGLSARAWYDIARDDLRTAAGKYRRIVELDQGRDPDLRNSLVTYAIQVGRNKQAIEIQRSMALIDPIYRRTTPEFASDYQQGRYAEMLRKIDEAARIDPTIRGQNFDSIFWANVFTGNYAEARKTADEFNMGPMTKSLPDFHFDPVANPDYPPDQLKLWADRTYGVGGRRQLAMHAALASQFDHQDVAMNYLRLAFERPGYGAYWMIWQPALAKLRKTDAFEDWVTEIGLVDIWREDNDWGDYCAPVSETEIACN
ncbi:TIR domain-containing protein [Altererythrobacter salegens]|uniref:TIR domain-containing protein n=1 Tax=Croceibacterium salegens TaxID=1737568 RepID=A0A6I4SUN4_9SPHN|nr:TIR domain-containing protein [Croceibacterium salegens]MXO59685.1 TIR domain-containing protein [Croceibacterium salegens]